MVRRGWDVEACLDAPSSPAPASTLAPAESSARAHVTEPAAAAALSGARGISSEGDAPLPFPRELVDGPAGAPLESSSSTSCSDPASAAAASGAPSGTRAALARETSDAGRATSPPPEAVAPAARRCVAAGASSLAHAAESAKLPSRTTPPIAARLLSISSYALASPAAAAAMPDATSSPHRPSTSHARARNAAEDRPVGAFVSGGPTSPLPTA